MAVLLLQSTNIIMLTSNRHLSPSTNKKFKILEVLTFISGFRSRVNIYHKLEPNMKRSQLITKKHKEIELAI